MNTHTLIADLLLLLLGASTGTLVLYLCIVLIICTLHMRHKEKLDRRNDNA